MQIKQMLFPMISMVLSMAPCFSSQCTRTDSGIADGEARPWLGGFACPEQGIFLSWRLLGTDSKNVCFDVEQGWKGYRPSGEG